MVLDDASSTESDDFSESAPVSDNDPYASNSEGAMKPLDLPRPIPIIGPLLGYNQQLIVKAIQLRVNAMSEVMERPVTADEARAMAYWTARQISITSYGQPLGIAVGWWRAYSTRNTFRFPFYQPKLETFNSEVFPSASRAWITGPRAVLAWHGARVGLYAMVGSWIGSVLFGSYAMSVTSVGEISDKRLQEYVQAVKKRMQRGQRGLGQQRPPHGDAAGAEHGSQRGPQPVMNDDASPTSGAYGDTDGSGNMNTYGMSQDPNQNTGVREAPSREQRAPTADNSRMYPMEKESRSFDDDFDDASPTGGRGAAADTGSPSGSAWERIRKQASSPAAGSHESRWPSGSGPGRPQSSSQDSAWSRNRASAQNNSSSGDSFSFSSEEEERQVARSEAQKEFDDRVDRERRGGDFSSGGGDQKRW